MVEPTQIAVSVEEIEARRERVRRTKRFEPTDRIPVIPAINLSPGQYLLHDRDSKFTEAFDETLKAAGVKAVKLPARSPNLNAHAERFVLSVKTECLSRMILFGEASLRRALSNFLAHYHVERPHQGKGNVILFPEERANIAQAGPVQCRERPGGLLRFYYRGAG